MRRLFTVAVLVIGLALYFWPLVHTRLMADKECYRVYHWTPGTTVCVQVER